MKSGQSGAAWLGGPVPSDAPCQMARMVRWAGPGGRTGPDGVRAAG